MLLAGLLTVAGCKDKKNEGTTIITTDYEAPKPTSPITMDSYSDTQDVEWVEGRRYTLEIDRRASDSLAAVTDANGQKYVDNTIQLKIVRGDGSVFFHRTFTKASFANWLGDEYRDTAILQGMRFLEVADGVLTFIVWLNNPGAGDDEAVELRMELDPQGEITTQRFTYDDRDDLIKNNEEEK
jgi:hypothetical protein